MVITARFIGTGDSESLRFFNTNLLVEAGGRRLLVDCGWTAKQALARIGLGFQHLDAVFITHVHGDHVFGLERAGFEGRYVHRRKLRLFVPRVLRSVLWDECLKGSMGITSEGEMALEDFFEVCEVEERFSWSGLEFQLFPTTHTPGKPSFGIRLAGAFVHTSDTNVLPDLPGLARDVELVFHDAHTGHARHAAHATPEEMAAAYPAWLLRKIVWVHYGDNVEDAFARGGRSFRGWARQGEVFRWAR